MTHARASTALLRAGLLGLAVLALLPLPVAAADGDPTAEPTPTVEPTPEPTPDPTPTPTPSLPVRTVFNYRSNTVVRQFDGSWCVAAATQTMWNLVKGVSNTTYSRQKSLYRQIRQHNRYKYRTLGNDIQGWAWALATYTGEPYRARSYANKADAIAAIVEAIDRTGHPVGITIHHGRHAWIVLGYKSRPVAEGSDDRVILGFYVSGPLGANSSDPWKYEYLSMSAFRKKYGYYHEWQRKVIWEGRYVLVSD